MFKSGDEVCLIKDGDLVFGTLEHPISRVNNAESTPSTSWKGGERNGIPQNVQTSTTSEIPTKLWRVKWVNDPSLIIPREVVETNLIPTDRALYKGCKVKKLTGDEVGKIGFCRSILHKVDLRVVGTNTIIPRVSISEFSHLKAYKQKSVVYYNGWLGVILSVQRKATVHQNDNDYQLDLQKIFPTGPLSAESPWINEQIEVPIDISLRNSNFNKNNGTSGSLNKTSTGNSELASKRSRCLAYIKDLSIESVKVHWSHQIDPNFPDKPKQEFKNNSHTHLKVVKEELSMDEASFSFDVGNLGRYKITNTTEFQRWDCWQKMFVKENFSQNEEVLGRLKKSYNAEEEQNYWRVYDNKKFIDDNTGEKLNIGQTLVVEIAHVSSTAHVQYLDSTWEVPNSSLDLQVLEESVLNTANTLVLGDFVYSKQLAYGSDEAFGVLVKIEENDCLKVVVLDTNVPGKVLDNGIVLNNDSRTGNRVGRHLVYQYFNEDSTIVVINDDKIDASGSNTRIGHVIGTNLMGKVNVKFIDSGREEWIYPQRCAIYSVKGYDLECVKSHITDSEQEIPVEVKIRSILESIRKKVELVWKNTSKTEEHLKESLTDLGILASKLENLTERLGSKISPVSYKRLTEFLRKPIGVGDDFRPSFFRGEPHVTELVLKCVQDMLAEGEKTVKGIEDEQRKQKAAVAGPSGDSKKRNGPQLATIEDELVEMFSNTVMLLESHPHGHIFASSTKFEPTHHKCFLKIIKDELQNLQTICSTEMRSQMGILTRGFSDRMDLMSILIRGPEGTPYENSVYLFDAVLPPSYPNVPPKFHFHSFKAGRLNPNLYAEGKVCVSLLGTWSGRDDREKWTKESNIVQVLISIQGLILVNEPYHNEPGYEVEKFTPQDARVRCLEYNLQLMPKILQMIINQLQFPMDPWKEELISFYHHQGPLLISRWTMWLNAKSESKLPVDKRPGFAIYPMTSTFITCMKNLLATLKNEISKLNKK